MMQKTLSFVGNQWVNNDLPIIFLMMKWKPTSLMLYIQWVDRYFWLLVLDSRDSKHKLEVTRLGQVVQINRFQKMNMKK
jgi:hypothetical protein